jgi:hypothetical protein
MASKPKRNYAKEEKWADRPENRKKQAERMRARRLMEKEGKVHKNDGKEVDHKKMLAEGGSNKRSNLRVVSRSVNRAKQPAHKGKNLHRK